TLAAFLGLTALTGWVYGKVPGGFIPQEDQGYFIIIVAAPEGASLQTTGEVLHQVEEMTKGVPEISGCFSVGGWSFLGSGPNRGTTFCSLKDWEERKKAGSDVESVIDKLRGPLMGIGGAFVLPFAPPSVEGVGSFGGFQFELEDQTGDRNIE